MPINQPPISDDYIRSTWELEVTQLSNQNEDLLKSTNVLKDKLIFALVNASNFADFQARIVADKDI